LAVVERFDRDPGAVVAVSAAAQGRGQVGVPEESLKVAFLALPVRGERAPP